MNKRRIYIHLCSDISMQYEAKKIIRAKTHAPIAQKCQLFPRQKDSIARYHDS